MAYFQGTSPRTLFLYGEDLNDLALMPTTTKVGEGEYHMGLAPSGSIALILTSSGLDTYMLRSSGWVKFVIGGGGGGGEVVSYNDLVDKPQINGVVLSGNTDLNTISENQTYEPGTPDNTEIINEWFN